MWLLGSSLLFYLVPGSPYISIRPSFAGLGGAKLKQDFCAVPCEARELGPSLTLLLLTWQGEFFLAEDFPLGVEQCWLEKRDDARKTKLRNDFPRSYC